MHRLDSKLHGFYSPPLGWLALQSIVMSMSVHLFVCVYVSLCLSVRYYKTVRPNFSKFLSMLPVAMARSFSDGAALRYVLPALRMTSCFHTLRPVGRVGHGFVWFTGQGPLWPTGSLARRAGLLEQTGRICWVGHAGRSDWTRLYCWEGDAHLAVCFMMVSSCALEQSLLSIIALL